ncbi:MAG: hypothetical protein JSS43_30880 [Proteobacteria bacterium]|nr:hypothetical protein [Pseudomonadota bacterium]
MDEHQRTPTSFLEMYGLGRFPFDERPDGSGFILFGSQRRVFEQVVAHLTQGSGVMTLRGDGGIGKTHLLLAAAAAARASTQVIAVVRPAAGRVDRDTLLQTIGGDGATPEDVIRTLLNRPRTAMVIDDVDLLTRSAQAVLSAILHQVPDRIAVAQTATVGRFDLPDGPAGREVALGRLGPAELRQYVEQRLWMAGGTTRRLISADALRLIVANGQGLPGTVNRMMEAVMTAGFARGDALITRHTVAAALGPAAERRERESGRRRRMILPLLATLLLLVGVSAFLYRGLIEEPPPSQVTKAP